jgi:hypothetical protein
LALDQEHRRNRLGQYLMRVLPRLAIILLVFIGLNWWTSKDRQQVMSTAMVTTQAQTIWDENTPRRPGSAIAIVIDEHRPGTVTPDVFNAWQLSMREFLQTYQTHIVQIAGKHDRLPVRVGFFRAQASLTDAQTGMRQELSPPSLSDVTQALDAGHWHGQQESLDMLMRQAVKALSDSGLESTMLLMIRYPLLESQESAYQIIARWKPALPQSPDGPRVVVDMELLKGASVSEPNHQVLQSLLKLAFPDLAIDLPAPSSSASN